MSKNILITGANRGLGLEFVTQYVKEDVHILACCRDPENAMALEALQKIHSNITIYTLDISSTSAIEALAQKITQPIDIMINNAGMLEKESFGQLSTQALLNAFTVNSIAPIQMAQAFSPHLQKGKTKIIACVSSAMGSISENTSGGYYSYRASKAALNMLMKSAGHDLAQYGIKVLLLHPGWVQTRMGGDSAPLSPQDSITGMRRVIETYAPLEGQVMFYRYNGEAISW